MRLSDPRFDPAQLCEALDQVPAGSWSLPSDYATTRVHHGYRRCSLVNAGRWLPEADAFWFVLHALHPVRESWLSWIGPGGFIVPHRDAGPWLERWQVPIMAAGEWHGDVVSVPVDGRAFRVEHWLPHAVANDSDRPRVHMVVDRDVKLNLPALPFELFPVPDSMAGLVDRSLHGAYP